MVKLLFHTSEHFPLFINFLNVMKMENANFLGKLMATLTNNCSDYEYKIIKESSKPAIHIGNFQESSKIYAWLELHQNHINLCLKHETIIDDIWKDISNRKKTSTPHTVIANKINEIHDFNIIIKMINRSYKVCTEK